VKAFVLWFTGLSGSGKSTLAEKIYKYIVKKDIKAECLDGDSVRAIFPNTGFTEEERNSHIKRIGYMASILERNDIVVVASFISPYKESRDYVRSICKNFIEVYVSTPVSECKKRDVKGLYKKARNGEIKNFTGIDAPYEPPVNPEINIPSHMQKEEESLKIIMDYINPYLK
jgi:adenylylsulfate kinase